MEKFKNKFRIPSARLANWDYGAHGLYFVTICTKDKAHFFGKVTSHTPAKEMQPDTVLEMTRIGEIAYRFWEQKLQHFPFVELDEFIIMPNHLHGILFINKPDYIAWKPNSFGPQSQNLASIIRGYKAGVKKYATMNQLEFSWQSRYFDRVIRSEHELQNIRQYIYNNPAKWETEQYNPENLLM